MKNGWCWNIPQRDQDHCGYVYSSVFCDDDSARKEVEERFNIESDFETIAFTSDRYENF